MPTVSVILPFYNAGKNFTQALQSLACQSFNNFECILVNNNSQDGSLDIARAFTQNDSRFILLEETRQGVSYASNTGSLNAKGEFIARMDADDYAFPNRLKNQVDYLKLHSDIGVVSGQVEFGGDKIKAAGLARYTEWTNSLTTPENIKQRRFIESPVINPSAMWRKAVETKLGGYVHGDFPEDYDMWLRWLQAGVKIAKIKDTVIRWNDSSTRLTRTDERYSTQAFYETKSKYLKECLKTMNPHHPEVYVWGASRLMRQRASILENHGIRIKAFIDITKKRQIDQPIIHYQDLPHHSEAFVLVYVPQVEIRKEIAVFLNQNGYIEGKHFLFVA